MIFRRIKAPKKFRNRSRATLYQKVEIFYILGAAFPPPCVDWCEILHGQADPGARRSCKVWPESVQRVAPAGEKPDFWPVSKSNTGSLPLRGILPVIISCRSYHLWAFSRSLINSSENVSDVYQFHFSGSHNAHAHARCFRGHFPGKSGLANCPHPWFSFSVYSRTFHVLLNSILPSWTAHLFSSTPPSIVKYIAQQIIQNSTARTNVLACSIYSGGIATLQYHQQFQGNL